MVRIIVLSLLLLLLIGNDLNVVTDQGAVYDAAIPTMQEPVNDLHGVLTIHQKLGLIKKIELLKRKNGAEVVVLIVPTTSGEPLSNYTFRAMDAWEKNHNRKHITVLMVINSQDASYFIGTSPMIQHVLPDTKVQSLSDAKVEPYWRSSQWFEGINAGISEIINIIDKEELVNNPVAEQAQLKVRDLLIFGLVLTGFIYALVYFVRWRRSSDTNINYIQHAIVFGFICTGVYVSFNHQSELDKLLEIKSSLSAEIGGVREMQGASIRFDAYDYVVPGAYTILYFYSNSCPGCKRLNTDLNQFVDVRRDVAVRKFDLGNDWSGDYAYNTYKLKIGKTPFIHIYDPSGELIVEDIGFGKEGLDLLYKWMNAELSKA